jgi:hypothetical protein
VICAPASGVDCPGLRAAPPPTPLPAAGARPARAPRRRATRDAMYRLLSAVTAETATIGGRVWGCGRRGAHWRAGLPPLGYGWAGGLGLGLGLALGAKLAGGLRGATPAQLPDTPDPEAQPLAEPPQEPSLALRAPQTPAPSPAKCFARAIDSSRDLLHRIKVRRRRRGPRARSLPQPLGGDLPGLNGPHPGRWGAGCRLPRKTSRFPTAGPLSHALGVA